jgi:hypothetical protein
MDGSKAEKKRESERDEGTRVKCGGGGVSGGEGRKRERVCVCVSRRRKRKCDIEKIERKEESFSHAINYMMESSSSSSNKH